MQARKPCTAQPCAIRASTGVLTGGTSVKARCRTPTCAIPSSRAPRHSSVPATPVRCPSLTRPSWHGRSIYQRRPNKRRVVNFQIARRSSSVFPACEFLPQQAFDLLHAPPIAAHLLGTLAVVVRKTHACGDFCLLAFQRFDCLRQRRKFALIFVAELAARALARAGARVGEGASVTAGAGRCCSQSL